MTINKVALSLRRYVEAGSQGGGAVLRLRCTYLCALFVGLFSARRVPPAPSIPCPVLPCCSMLASNTDRRRPPGDADYCARMRGRSPKETR